MYDHSIAFDFSAPSTRHYYADWVDERPDESYG